MEITKKHLILGKDCIEDLPHMKQFDRIFLTGDKHRAFDEMYDDAEKIGFTERDLLVFLGDVCVNYYGATPSMAAEDRSAKNELSSLFPCTFLYDIEICTRNSCDYIQKTLVESTRISYCHG